MDRLWQGWKSIASNSLAQSAGWVLLGQGLSVGCVGAYFILLARLLGSTEYGIYVGVVATVSILSQYSTFGSGPVLLRYVCQAPQTFSVYWGSVLITTITVGSLFVALLAWGVPHLAHSYSWPLVFCVAVGDCLCAQLTTATGLVFQAFEKMHVTAILSLLVNLLRAILAGVMLSHLHHATAQEWAVAALAASLVAVFLSVILVNSRFGKPTFSFRLVGQRAGEGFVFALSGSTTVVYNNIDKAMLGHYGMNAANGIYTMAYRLVDLAHLPISSIHSAAFPRFFRKGSAGVESTTAYGRKILKRTAPIGVGLALAMFLGAPLIPYLAGNSFREAVLALRWLSLLPFFRSFQLSAGDALTGAGHQKSRLYSQAAAALFNFGTNLYLIPRFGWRGAAWSSLATDGMLGLVNWAILGGINRGMFLGRSEE
jgi:O-antigen/teichoic acid export membrane protein